MEEKDSKKRANKGKVPELNADQKELLEKVGQLRILVGMQLNEAMLQIEHLAYLAVAQNEKPMLAATQLVIKELDMARSIIAIGFEPWIKEVYPTIHKKLGTPKE